MLENIVHTNVTLSGKMFNFNRIINRIREPERTRETPPQSPHRTLSPDVSDADQSAEGFLCPTCMQGFPSAEELHSHYEDCHSEENNTGHHLCPVCRMKMKTRKELQDHYSEYHVTQKNGDLEILRQEVANLNTTLREEKHHSDDLMRELQRLQVEVMSSKGDGERKTELEDIYKIQIKSLEETKALMSSEVLLLRKQLSEAFDTNTVLKQDKERLEHEAAELVEEVSNLKADADRALSVKSSVEEVLKQAQENISCLEAELQQRPAADDVAVLQQELIQVQTLMDKTASQKEEEKENLDKKYQEMKLRYSQLASETQNLKDQLETAPKLEELERLKTNLLEKSSGSQELHASLKAKITENEELLSKVTRLEMALAGTASKLKDQENFEQTLNSKDSKLEELSETCKNLEEEILKRDEILRITKDELSEVQIGSERNQTVLNESLLEREQQLNETILNLEKTTTDLNESESKLTLLTDQLNLLQTQLQQQTVKCEELEQKLWDKDSKIEVDTREMQLKESKIHELEKDLQNYKETNSRLESERTDLYAKIEAGEGANTAIQQLKQETATVQEKLNEQQKQTELQIKECTKKLESLHEKLQATKHELKTANDKCLKMETTVKDMASKLASSQCKVEKLEADMKTKNEQIFAYESEKRNMKSVLENEITVVKSESEKMRTELQKYKQKNAATEKEMSKQMSAKKKLEDELCKQTQNSSNLETKLVQLENCLKEEKDTVGNLSSTIDDLQKKLQEMTSRLHNSEQHLQQLTGEYENQKALSEENIKKSESKLWRMDAERTELLNTKNALEKLLAETQDELTKTVNELISTRESAIRNEKSFSNDLNECKKNWKTEVETLTQKISVIEKDYVKINEEFQKQNTELESLTTTHEALVSNKLQIEEKVLCLRKQLEDKDALIEAEVVKLTKANDSLKETSVIVKEQQLELEGLKEENKKQSLEINVLKTSCDESDSKLKELENLIAEKDVRCNEIAEEKNKMEAELHECIENEKSLSRSLEDLSNVKNMMGQQILSLDTELKAAMEEQQVLKLQKASLETEVFSKQKELSEIEESKHVLDKRMKEVQEHFEQEIKRNEDIVNNLIATREAMKVQKDEIEKQLENCERLLADERKHRENTEETMRNEIDRNKTENNEISKQLVELQSAHLATVQEKEQNEAKYEMQIGALKENLATLRGDLVSEQTKSKETGKKLDVLTGDKLELEAKLENALDERRALLERCLLSETECEKLRETSSQLRHKLDESQAAVHELGRENQTLQIESAKLTSRRWADDSLVTNCTLCQKLFSVTIRKHHCRNCGNIFCGECSTRTATIASSKKPVRVCDLCFADISK